MDTIKIVYALELEVPAETLVADGDVYLTGVRRMLIENAHRGWRCRLRRLIGVEKVDATKNRNNTSR